MYTQNEVDNLQITHHNVVASLQILTCVSEPFSTTS